MPNNITMLKDLINPEVMADMISATVEAMILATPYARVDNTLVNNEGDTITIPRFTYIGDAIEVGEGEDLPMQKLGTSSAEYTVKMTGNGVTLTDKDLLSAHGDIVGEVTRQLAVSIAQKLDSDVINELYKAKRTFVASGVIDYDGIVDAIDLFNDERDGEKVMFIHPKQKTQLRHDPDFISVDKYGGNVMMSGEFGMIAGVRLVSSRKVKNEGGYYFNPVMKLVPTNSETDTRDAAITVFVKRDTNVETERNCRNRTTEITVDKNYVVALTDETKVIIAKFGDGITQLSVSPESVEVEEEATSSALTITTEASDFTMESGNTGIATVNKGAKTITGVAEGETDVTIEAQADGKAKASKKVAVKVTAKTE